jgi:hypothetical protein
METTMLHTDTTLEDWLRIVRAEYREFPGLRLTKAQVQRLWNLDTETCEAVIRALEGEHFIRRTAGAAYVRADN